MSDKGILKTSDSFAKNIKLTKTDLEVLEKHVSFFPPDLLYKERRTRSNYNNEKNTIMAYKNFRQNNQVPMPIPAPHATNISQTTPKMTTSTYQNTKLMTVQNKVRLGQRGISMRFT